MDSDRLNALLIDPSLGNRDDYMEIKQLAEEYPYAQFLRILLAKIARLLNEEDQVKVLHSAAIYSADRKVLKEYYTGDHYQSVIPPDQITLHKPKVIFPDTFPDRENEDTEGRDSGSDPNAGTEAQPDPAHTWASKDEMIKEVMENLKDLENLKSTFDKPDTEDSGPDKTETESPNKGADYEGTGKGSGKTEKTEIDQPESYQKQLIDDFISNISNVKIKSLLPPSPDVSHEDLASESIAFDSNLVTETLAKLYVKQGKTDKAIEIYRKLIWKFPQKKAYFAAQIEELNG